MSDNGSPAWEGVRTLCLDPSRCEYDVTSVSDAVTSIIDVVGEEDFPEHVAAAVKRGLFSEAEGALLVGVATYSTDDEGLLILQKLVQWLKAGEDEIRIALALDQDSFAFDSYERKVMTLEAIAARFPRFAHRCRDLLSRSSR